MKRFSLYLHPGICWKVNIVLHRSRASVRRARRRLGKSKTHHAIEGFCHEWPTAQSDTTGILAEIHLYSGCDRGTIIHECAHAVLHASSVLRIDLNNGWGNETFAQMCEHLTEGTLHGVNMDFRKKT